MDGWAVAHGLPDLRRIDIGRYVNFIWWFWTRDASEVDKQKFKSRVWMPEKGKPVTDKRSPWAPENERAAFAGLKASLGL